MQEEWARQDRARTEQKEQKRILLKETEKRLNGMGFRGKVVQLGPELSAIWEMEEPDDSLPNSTITGGDTLEGMLFALKAVQFGRFHKRLGVVREWMPRFKDHLMRLERMCSPE